MIKHVRIVNIGTGWVVSLMRTNFFKVAVSLLAKTFPWLCRAVLIVIIGTDWVVSLMRTNFFKVAKTFPWLRRRPWLPVLVVISQEDGRAVPLTPPVDLSPAVLLGTNTEPAVTTRVGWAGSDTLALSGPPDNQLQIFLSSYHFNCEISLVACWSTIHPPTNCNFYKDV